MNEKIRKDKFYHNSCEILYFYKQIIYIKIFFNTNNNDNEKKNYNYKFQNKSKKLLSKENIQFYLNICFIIFNIIIKKLK